METSKGHAEDPPVTIFISYRKSEADAWALALYATLSQEFGAENVFCDVPSLQPGEKWLQGIRSGSAGCTAFISLIGPTWAKTLKERTGSGADYVREEIETALKRGSQVREVIPALIDEASMPTEDDIGTVGTVKPLLKRQKVELRPSSWPADVKALVERLKQPPPPEPESPAESAGPAASAGPADVTVPPEDEPFTELAKLLFANESLVVPFLGPGANSCDRTEPWQGTDSAYLPDSEELAAYLAGMLGLQPTAASLALISQQLSVAKGPGDLHKALRLALPPRRKPGPVHSFLAGLPARLHDLGAPNRYQLIVTTNYDDALEQAFEEAEESFDLAVYISQGEDKGKFVHIPCDGEPRVASPANEYSEFPIDLDGRVERTVIMKIHGAIDRRQGPYSWRNNYVITEDDYIGYMTAGAGSIVPLQLLGKLLDNSHFLFLGHEMHDWSLRVFLIRVFGENGRPENTSWAVEHEPTKLDERFWGRMGVDLAAVSLEECVEKIETYLRIAAAEQPQS